MYFDNKIGSVLRKFEKLLYGHNYEVHLGIDIFMGKTMNDFELHFRNKYPKVQAHFSKFLPLTREQFLTGIINSLSYRGDKGAGVVLTPEKEIEFQKLENKYFKFLNQFLSKEAKLFYYSDKKSIPFDFIFWGYSYVIFTDNDKIIFVFGSSSD